MNILKQYATTSMRKLCERQKKMCFYNKIKDGSV